VMYGVVSYLAWIRVGFVMSGNSFRILFRGVPLVTLVTLEITDHPGDCYACWRGWCRQRCDAI